MENIFLIKLHLLDFTVCIVTLVVVKLLFVVILKTKSKESLLEILRDSSLAKAGSE
ncbi:hypothetical protein JCM12825_16370 [Desulfurobacterium crinifex]